MRQLKRELSPQYRMVGTSSAMQQIFRQIERVAPTNGWVLITGESGTGKELVARAIHDHSHRAAKPFVKVNCAAIPEELIESELFGHEKGAFTGAIRTKQGEFEHAHTGTIFLDEIGDMSAHAQAKVLRVLNSGEFSRVGGDRSIQVDVRVIAATNRDLEVEIGKGRFREDLYFRLNVIPLHLPPLRERRDDIPILLESFLEYYCKLYNYAPIKLTTNALKRIMQYPWPGNIRELRNLAERLAILHGPTIDVDDLPAQFQEKRALLDVKAMGNRSLKEVREEIERSYITLKLTENQWNISRTADVLGIERTNLHKKMNIYQIQRP
jgi:two-component system nitrogen regulation response regulator NtrX